MNTVPGSPLPVSENGALIATSVKVSTDLIMYPKRIAT